MTDLDEPSPSTLNVLAKLPYPAAYLSARWEITFCNDAYRDRFRLPPGQRAYSSPRLIMDQDSAARIRPIFEAALLGTDQLYEGEITSREGHVRAVRLQYIPDRNVDGRVVGVIVIHHDVFHQQQRDLMTKLEDSQRHLRMILDSVQHGIWGLDVRGHVTFINRRALDLLGYDSSSDVIGRLMHQIAHHTHPDGRPHPVADCPMYDSFRNQRTHHVLDDVLWRKDGTSFPVAYYSTPVIEDGVCVGAVVTFEDTSLQKTLEVSLDQERAKSIRNAKLASLGEMSAGVAHEINNPLAIISGTVGLLSKFKDQPEMFERKIESIKKSSARIARIVKGLQKFSRSGDTPNFKPHSLTRLIGEALVLTEPKSFRHSTPVSLGGQSSALVLCDEVEIEQVIINLINNAIDAVDALGQKWVRLDISDHGDEVVLRVTDSGEGIPESARNRLFEPFFTTKGVGRGTGLGLSIVKGILDEHWASIAVLPNEPNTCFELRFPTVPTV